MSTQNKFMKSPCFSLTLALLSPSFCLANEPTDVGESIAVIQDQDKVQVLMKLKQEIESDRARLEELEKGIADAKYTEEFGEKTWKIGVGGIGLSGAGLGAIGLLKLQHPNSTLNKRGMIIVQIGGAILLNSLIMAAAGDSFVKVSQLEMEKLKTTIKKVSADLDTREKVLTMLIESFPQEDQ